MEKIVSFTFEESYDRTDIEQAFKKSLEVDKLPTGIFYRIEKPVYEEDLKQIERKPLMNHIISDIDINKLLNRYY